MRVDEVLKKTTHFFKGKGFLSARLDAEVLLSHALNCRRLDLYLRFDSPLSEKELSGCRALVKRRGEGEPVAYITGKRDFYEDSFIVRPGVLIPRPETELLVEEGISWVKENCRDQENIQMVDFGTGSGCLGLSLLRGIESGRLVGLDISKTAILCAEENSQNLELSSRSQFHCIDVEKSGDVIAPGSVDIVVANPPYIGKGDGALDPLVKKFEPSGALFSDENGFAAIKSWREVALKILKPGGLCIFEIGYSQGSVAKDLFATHFINVEVKKDLARLDRMVMGVKAHG